MSCFSFAVFFCGPTLDPEDFCRLPRKKWTLGWLPRSSFSTFVTWSLFPKEFFDLSARKICADFKELCKFLFVSARKFSLQFVDPSQIRLGNQRQDPLTKTLNPRLFTSKAHPPTRHEAKHKINFSFKSSPLKLCHNTNETVLTPCMLFWWHFTTLFSRRLSGRLSVSGCDCYNLRHLLKRHVICWMAIAFWWRFTTHLSRLRIRSNYCHFLVFYETAVYTASVCFFLARLPPSQPRFCVI